LHGLGILVCAYALEAVEGKEEQEKAVESKNDTK
jgi:hypothetical protein